MAGEQCSQIEQDRGQRQVGKQLILSLDFHIITKRFLGCRTLTPCLQFVQLFAFVSLSYCIRKIAITRGTSSSPLIQ